ncbi:uncharacterized protein LOC117104422 [Anneissia japonica]|uniref:uncharacterized protein LOC117104422 n=1 Tax=Anneissia japonica TaxID=1529436 RepID=UPI001425B14F|nr:uncharacterized protein LOC117104422 [Anneissia japonica]
MVAYIRSEDINEAIHCSLVLARSRVTPLKHLSIPRLELTAATMAVRIAKMLEEELDQVHETYFWTDSQTVLKYINNTSRRFKTFVANRVAVITEATSPSQWGYVRTTNNPADDTSRGLSINQFLKNERWIKGPSFLQESVEQWPKMQEISLISEDDPEIKREVNTGITVEESTVMDNLIKRYSSFNKLRRIVAWLLVLKKNLRQRIIPATNKSTIRRLEVEHLQAAEREILMQVQQQYFSKEIKALKGNNPNEIAQALKYSQLRKLDPTLHDKLLCVGGRLDRSDLPESARHPVIVPKNSLIAEYLILDAHKEVGHLGRNTVLNAVRERFWILGARAIIRTVISRCVTCHKHRASPGQQKMASLPRERVLADFPPFYNSDMDMFGPFEIKRGRSTVKRYGLIFTCLASRAIHLEITHSMDTDSCLNALRRFIARRGGVSSIRSDNGTNFVGVERELREAVLAWNASHIPDWLHQRNIKWIFNPPSASHFGGAWERQIRTVRQVMKGVLQEQHITKVFIHFFAKWSLSSMAYR